jgi:Lar family restriction alleviation protein
MKNEKELTISIHLEPCPFCGADDMRKKQGEANLLMLQNLNNREIAMVCQECTAAGPFSTNGLRAVAMWNQRAKAE